jgi:hypothetical protein
VLVVYTKFPSPSPKFPAPTVKDILPPVAPTGKEPGVTAFLDKFLRTNLDKLLKGKHITTVIVVAARDWIASVQCVLRLRPDRGALRMR